MKRIVVNSVATSVARSVALTVALAAALALLGGASAFEWAPGEFPTGDQRYTLEFRFGEGDEAQRATLQVDIVEQGEGYDVTSTITSQKQLQHDELGLEAFGMGGLGPALLFGPTFMVLPLVLEDQDIRVREEPVEMPGMGRLHMDRSEQVAGFECVVIRLEQPQQPEAAFEFAVAEELPFPCFSSYGSGEDAFEMRLLQAE